MKISVEAPFPPPINLRERKEKKKNGNGKQNPPSETKKFKTELYNKLQKFDINNVQQGVDIVKQLGKITTLDMYDDSTKVQIPNLFAALKHVNAQQSSDVKVKFNDAENNNIYTNYMRMLARASNDAVGNRNTSNSVEEYKNILKNFCKKNGIQYSE
jgi:hypothetical protein